MNIKFKLKGFFMAKKKVCTQATEIHLIYIAILILGSRNLKLLHSFSFYNYSCLLKEANYIS